MTDKCFSWGPQKEKNGSYKLPILTISKDEGGKLKITDQLQDFYNLWATLIAQSKKFCLENKEKIGRHELDPIELKKIGSCHYGKRDKEGKVDKTISPYLYAKVKANTKTGKVFTNFHKAVGKKGEDHSLVLSEIEGRRCELRAHLHFESIFVNSIHITLQVKVLEAAIYPRKETSENVIPIVVEEEESLIPMECE